MDDIKIREKNMLYYEREYSRPLKILKKIKRKGWDLLWHL